MNFPEERITKVQRTVMFVAGRIKFLTKVQRTETVKNLRGPLCNFFIIRRILSAKGQVVNVKFFNIALLAMFDSSWSRMFIEMIVLLQTFDSSGVIINLKQISFIGKNSVTLPSSGISQPVRITTMIGEVCDFVVKNVSARNRVTKELIN